MTPSLQEGASWSYTLTRADAVDRDGESWGVTIEHDIDLRVGSITDGKASVSLRITGFRINRSDPVAGPFVWSWSAADGAAEDLASLRSEFDKGSARGRAVAREDGLRLGAALLSSGEGSYTLTVVAEGANAGFVEAIKGARLSRIPTEPGSEAREFARMMLVPVLGTSAAREILGPIWKPIRAGGAASFSDGISVGQSWVEDTHKVQLLGIGELVVTTHWTVTQATDVGIAIDGEPGFGFAPVQPADSAAILAGSQAVQGPSDEMTITPEFALEPGVSEYSTAEIVWDTAAGMAQSHVWQAEVDTRWTLPGGVPYTQTHRIGMSLVRRD